METPVTAPVEKRRILFVDDDPHFLQTVDRVMRLWSKNSLEILRAQTASAALSVLQEQAVNLLVVDVCMPVIDGLQFLGIVHRRYPGVPKVVLTGYATETYRTACLNSGAELFLEKPRTAEGMESLLATLDELTKWQPESGFRGVLRRVELLDVIQMECLGRTSSLLAISSPKISGAIYIHEGAIIHAEANGLKGESALKELLALGSGEFRHNPYSEPGERTIHGSWQGLLMDAAQSRDEIAGMKPDPESAPEEIFPAEPDVQEPAPPALVRIDELLICSEAGDVLHAWQCTNTDLRISLLEFFAQKARMLQNVLSLGTFDRAEFAGEGARLVALVGGGRGVVLRSSPVDQPAETNQEALARRLRESGRSNPVQKVRAQEWFQQHLSLAGLLAVTLQFPDRTGLSHAVAPKFGPDALESLRRTVSDGFQVLRLQKFSASNARWLYDQTIIECAQWRDGTLVAFVLSRQTFELNRPLIEQCMQEFVQQESAGN